jgi:hypothetical protein
MNESECVTLVDLRTGKPALLMRYDVVFPLILHALTHNTQASVLNDAVVINLLGKKYAIIGRFDTYFTPVTERLQITEKEFKQNNERAEQ